MELTPERPERYWLTEAENRRIFRDQILLRKYANLQPADQPSLHYVAGQPGAGKSYLQKRMTSKLREQAGYGAVMQIIGDELRPFHPAYAGLLEQDDQLAAFFTDHDSGLWVEQAIAHSLQTKPHVVLEGTFRRPSVVDETVSRYQQQGFDRHLHIIAVHALISRTRIIGRYLSQIATEEHGRYTTTEAHDVAYTALPESLAAVAKAGGFETITLYRGNSQPLFVATALDLPTSLDQLMAALHQERSAPYIPPADLLARIEQYRRLAERYDRQQCLEDIQALQQEMHTNWGRVR
jgi:UDP-N-acetylglucosamine kinase